MSDTDSPYRDEGSLHTGVLLGVLTLRLILPVFPRTMTMIIPSWPFRWHNHFMWWLGISGIAIYSAGRNIFAPLPESLEYWNQASSELNSDITGIGVRIGLYLPMLLTIISLFLGQRKSHESGTKELGVAQLGNLVYIAFNLAKAQFDLETLEPIEALVTCMCIDAIVCVISMTHFDKESLASRNYIFWSVLISGLALLLSFITLFRISYSCPPDKVLLAAWFIPIIHPEKSNNIIKTGLILFCISRVWSWLFSAWVALRSTIVYDKAKKMNSFNEYPEMFERPQEFESLPATIPYFVDQLYAFPVFVICLETILYRYGASKPGEWTAWGQSAAMLTCLYGSAHWFYTLWHNRNR